MGVASLVLGIIGLFLCFIPFIGIIGLLFAIIGLVLGIVDWVQKKKKDVKHGQAMAGVICSAIAIVIVIVYTILASLLVANGTKNIDGEKLHEFVDSVENFDEEKVQNFLNSIKVLDEDEKFDVTYEINSSFDA